MSQSEAAPSGMAPEAGGCFVVILQGSSSMAGVVEGIEGVKEFLLRALWRDPGGAVLDEVAAIVSSLEDPEAWAVHGPGDGRPYWHWWMGYEGGSVTVQRLTEELPSRPQGMDLRSALSDAIAALTEGVRDLQSLAGAGKEAYVFTSRRQAESQD
jgi:hypothetical protein